MREEYENPMIRPREREEYSMYCDLCDDGIPFLSDYYELPFRDQKWCERCFGKHMSYAKHRTICKICGEGIEEDEECLVTDDAECICLRCLPEGPSVNY